MVITTIYVFPPSKKKTQVLILQSIIAFVIHGNLNSHSPLWAQQFLRSTSPPEMDEVPKSAKNGKYITFTEFIIKGDRRL